MSKFVLTAQLKLQSPKNTRQVISDLRKQLSGVNIPVEVKGAAQAKKQIDRVTRSAKEASNQAKDMGRSFGLAFKRFAAFTVASRAVSLFTNTLAGAVDEAIDFQREMVKISQVTGKTMDQLKGLERTIFNLSKTLGVNSKELLSTTRILSQAGIKAKELDVALAALAKTTLAPTFENITETAEGAIAILAQFKQGVGALENQLGSINAVAGQFAVESGDLIGAVRRTGGVFKEAGGTLEEFLGVFTSVRATTRESAESIATGLRTIFTRIQRPKTIEFLRQYGVELQDLDGKFVGPFEAVKRLNAALSGLGERDIRFVKIAEELGGFRQIGKVIPLLKEFNLAEAARQAAVDGGNSLTEDAAKAQIALATQIAKVKAEFAELIQNISNTGTFQALVKTSLNLASALIKVADAIKPLIPLITVFAGVKLAKGLGSFASGFGGAIRGAASLDPRRKAQGGKILAFNSGGFVPGTGNRDTVPAVLSPGEFVIRKSSVKKIGADNLAAMNAKGYAKGGLVGEIEDGSLGLFALKRGQQGQEAQTKKDTTWNAGSISNKKGALAALDEEYKLKLKGTGDKVAAFGNLTGDAQQRVLGKSESGKRYLDDLRVKYPELKPKSTVGLGSTALKNLNPKSASKQKNALSDALVDADVPDSEYPASLPFQFTGVMKEMILGQKVDSPADRRTLMEDVRDQVYQESAKGMQDIVTALINKEGHIADVKKGVEPTVRFDEGAFSGHIKNMTRTVSEEGTDKFSSAVSSVAGFIQEGLVAGLTGATIAGGGERFDFPNLVNQRDQLAGLYGGDFKSMEAADAKPSTAGTDFTKNAKKLAGSISENKDSRFFKKGTILNSLRLEKFNQGGSPSDTVPALLTPGEFVINKASSQKIGYGTLNRMNKQGVTGFNKGGPVGFNKGGGVTPPEFSSSKAPELKQKYETALAESAAAAEEQAEAQKQIANLSREMESAQKTLAKINEESTKLHAAAHDEWQKNQADQSAASAAKDEVGAAVQARDKAAGAEQSAKRDFGAKGVELDKGISAAKDKVASSSARRDELAKAQARVATKMGKQGEGPQTKAQEKAAKEFAIITAELEKEEKAIKDSKKEIDDLNKAREGIANQYLEVKKKLEAESQAAQENVNAKQQAADAAQEQADSSEKSFKEAKGKADEHVKANEQKVKSAEGRIQKFQPMKDEAIAKAGAAKGGVVAAEKQMKGAIAADQKAQKFAKNLQTAAVATGAVITALNFLKPTIDENSSTMEKMFAGMVDGLNSAVTWLGSVGFALQAFGVQLNKETLASAARSAKSIGADLFKGGGKGLGSKITGGLGKVGTGLSGAGGKLSSMGANLASKGGLAAKAGGMLSSAGGAAAGAGGALSGGAGAAIGSGAGAAASALASVAAPTAAMTAAVWGVTAAMDSLAGVNGEYEKAVEEGNIKAAGEAKLREKNQKGLNKLAMATTAAGGVIGGVLGSFIPGLGTIVGAALGSLAGAIVGLIPKILSLGPTLLKKAVVGIGKFIMWVGTSLKNLGDNILNFLSKIPIIGVFFKAIKKVREVLIGSLVKAFNYVKEKITGAIDFFTGIFSSLNDLTGGILGKVASAFMMLFSPLKMVYDGFMNFRDTFGWLLGMDSSEAVKQQAEANAAMEIYTNNVEKNAQAQKDLLADIKSGESDQTFNEAMKGGGLTKNLSAALTAGQERVESGAVNLVMDKTGMFASEEDNAKFGDANKNMEKVREDMKRQTNEETGQLETDEQMKKRLTDEGYREEDAQGMVDSQKAISEEFNKAKPQFQQLAKNVTLAGGEASNFEDFLSNLSDEDVAGLEAAGKMDELEQIFEQQRKATLENIKYIEALNFGLRDATGAAVAMSATMDNIASSQTAGFNTFAASATTLGNAMTAAGKHITEAEMDSAIGDLETSMRSFGATEEQISGATGTIRGMQQVQANTGAALDATKAILKKDASTDPETIKQTLGDELLKGVDDPEAKGRLQAAIDKLDLSAESGNLEKIQAGKLDEVLKETLDPVAEAVTAEAIELANKRAEAENKLIAATQNRLKAEQEYIAAQKQAIDTQLEAGKLFEEFGGAKQTSEDVLGARTAQANLTLGAAGVGGLGAGNAADIRRALSDTQNKFIKQQDAANFGTLGMARGATGADGKAVGPAFAGAAGVDEDKRQQLQDANKALVDFTRQRIGLIQEELKIAQQKNAAEKSALDSLLAGDIEGYLEQQQAAAAGAALRTGDASLASAFGAGALGAGLKTLEGQGLSGKEMERASSLALGGVGISDPRAAQVMAGTTAEEEALKAEGRELSQVLGEGAQMGADLKDMQVKAANVVIEAQKIEMDSLMNKEANAGDGAIGDPVMKARGGMIYANRGMFVPRGTDTVPAMLTPGEFVVNRAAVQRGNNLALLMAMNGGGGASSMGGAMGMSRGGVVYMADGGLLGKLKDMYSSAGSAIIGEQNMQAIGDMNKGMVDGIINAFTGPGEAVVGGLKDLFENSLGKGVFGMFEESVKKLSDFQLSVKVDPTNVNVNFNGANFLEGLRDDIKQELLAKVREELSQGKFNESGQFQTKPGGLS